MAKMLSETVCLALLATTAVLQDLVLLKVNVLPDITVPLELKKSNQLDHTVLQANTVH